MSRELADITIEFKELENVVFDEIIEFLEDQNIKYEVKAKNQYTQYEEYEPGFMEKWKEWKEREMCDRE